MTVSAKALLYVAPEPGSGGVGDYALDMVEAMARTAGAAVRPFWTPGPGDVTWRDLRRLGHQLEAVSREYPRGDLSAHFELSAVSLAPFWLLWQANLGGCLSATVHDAPHGVWRPLRSATVARHRALDHAIHYPFRAWWANLDHRVLRQAHVIFALSEVGTTALEAFHDQVRVLPHYIPIRPQIRRVTARPRAIGLYGHVYGGKGFERLHSLRDCLPSSVQINVAGRGTEALPSMGGVTIWGTVDGDREAKFFDSIRLLMLPYQAGGRYGQTLAASGSAARAFAYGTPVIAPPVRGFKEDALGGAIILGHTLDAMCSLASELVSDPAALEEASAAVEALKTSRLPRKVAAALTAELSVCVKCK